MIDWAIVGKRVICIDDKWESSYVRGEILPHLDQILTIREVISEGDFLSFRFEEIHNKPMWYIGQVKDRELMFQYYHFRPVRDTSIDNFYSLLVDDSRKKKRELENA